MDLKSVRVEQSAYSDASGTQRGKIRWDRNTGHPTEPKLHTRNITAGLAGKYVTDSPSTGEPILCCLDAEWKLHLGRVGARLGSTYEVSLGNGGLVVPRANCFRFPDPPDVASFLEAAKAKAAKAKAAADGRKGGKQRGSVAGPTAGSDKAKVCVLAPEVSTGLYVPGKVKGWSHKTGEFKILLLGETNPANIIRVVPNELVQITRNEYRYMAARRAGIEEKKRRLLDGSLPPQLAMDSSVERTVAIMLNGSTHSKWGQELLAMAGRLPHCSVVMDGAAYVSEGQAKEFYGDLVGTERETLIRMMSLSACHVAVLEGPGVIRRWLELIEDTLGQHRKSQRILMHGSWSMLSAAQAIKFFFDIPPPAQGIEFKTEAKNIIDTADEFIPVHGQSAFSQWSWDGWFYQVYVRHHLCDDLYTTGDLSGFVTCQKAGQMIFEHEWEPPREVGDAVLSEHPGHTNSYAPACVTEVLAEGEAFRIKFYDSICATVAKDDCVLLSKDRYSYDALVSSVKAVEDDKIGIEVIARDDDMGLFFRGTIGRVARQSSQLATEGHDGMPDAKTEVTYTVTLQSGKVVRQPDQHIFSKTLEGSNMLFHEFLRGNQVIALRYRGDEDSSEYQYDVLGPAEVVGTDFVNSKYRVLFWDGKEAVLGREDMYFILDPNAFDKSVQYIAARSLVNGPDSAAKS